MFTVGDQNGKKVMLLTAAAQPGPFRWSIKGQFLHCDCPDKLLLSICDR